MSKETISKKNFNRLKQIKVLLTDVDGVLTDGGMYYTEAGLVMKKFNAKDGMGVKLLRETGIKTGIISADKTPIAKKRADVLKFDFISYGVENKLDEVKKIISENGFTPEQIAFIGDDVNDLEVLDFVGLSICPKDAASQVIKKCHLVTPQKGGECVFRYISDLIIFTQK
ncbi:MAG: HAD hydrolase family protein [Ignavibacteriaceae bacterium]|nr:HAD hydrolase family protein [Ignavibacteriaceae bacterium]